MKKLLLVGSNTIHTYNYLELVGSYFDEILLVTNEKRSDSVYTTIEVDFSLSVFNLFRTVKKLKGIIQEFDPSIVHIHQANSYALYALMACSKLKIPKVLTAWGSDILLVPQSNFLLKKMVQYNLKNADYFTSDSVFMGEEMKRLAPSVKDILIANFGISVAPQVGVKENVIYSNRLHKKLYRIDKIIIAFGKFLETRESEDWKLVIAATGEDTNSLKELTKKLKIDKNVEFVGWVDKEINGSWYSKSKFWISIPESDATAISLLEAMACGCIPIVSDLPANKEWINNGENGLIVKDVDSSFIDAALKIDQDYAIEQNIARIERDGTKEANKIKFIQLYETIISKR